MSWRDKDDRRRARDEIETQRDANSEGVAAGTFAKLFGPVVVFTATMLIYGIPLNTYTWIGLGVLGFTLIFGFLKIRAARSN